MKYNPQKHHRKSICLKGYDYSQAGMYFVTICCHDRLCLFGHIENGKMILSPTGIVADVLWHEIKNHVPNVELGEFIVMPNHIHGIIIITTDNVGGNVVGTTHALSLPPPPRFQNQGKNTLSSIVGSYKSAVSKHVHRLGFEFSWQRNYYEHIIRNEQSYKRISEYIMNNPAKWNDDKFYID